MSYPLVDIFRIISAVLVVSIHTLPFKDIVPVFDFYLVRGLGRIAVPFFFMTTAYFYFLKPSKERLIKILKQYLLVYIVAIIIYLPINLYNLCYLQANLLFNVIKAIVFDGTFYHLWYLPATVMGLIIVSMLHKYVSLKKGLVIVSVLYLIGLGGDSYYGLVNNVPVIKNFYDIIFVVCDYTRNGLFMAPLFLWLGKWVVSYQDSFKTIDLAVGLIVSMGLMVMEVSVLRTLGFPRHDAMNLMLPVVMVFLYLCLLKCKGKRLMICKNLSLLIYLLHPWVIVLVRIISKLTHVEALINNGLVHFIDVLVITLILSLLIIGIRRCYDEQKNNTQLDRS